MRSFLRSGILLALGALVLTIGSQSFAAVSIIRYTVTEIPAPFPGYTVTPTGINDHGVITGYTAVGGGAFRFANGTSTFLSNFGGATAGNGINNAGQVTGYSSTSGGQSRYAFIDTNGHMEAIAAAGSDAIGYAINDAGHVVGYSGNTAFLYTGSNFVTLPGVGSFTRSYARNLNNQDDVVGTVTNNNGLGYPVLYSGGTAQIIGNQFGTATAINETGLIVGNLSSGGGRGFMWDGTNFTTLPLLPNQGFFQSTASDVNDRGDIVSYNASSTTETATIYTSQSGIADLQTLIDPASGWHLSWANAINNSGQIVGVGSINQRWGAFLLTPIPEPKTMLLAAVLGIGLLRRRQPTTPGRE